jgi:hypothetical protein
MCAAAVRRAVRRAAAVSLRYVRAVQLWQLMQLWQLELVRKVSCVWLCGALHCAALQIAAHLARSNFGGAACRQTRLCSPCWHRIGSYSSHVRLLLGEQGRAVVTTWVHMRRCTMTNGATQLQLLLLFSSGR